MTSAIAKQILRILFFFFCAITSVTAQENNLFEKLDLKESNIQSIVYCIAQDHFGNIWTGTEEGVVRFNSRETYLYNRYQGLPKNIPAGL